MTIIDTSKTTWDLSPLLTSDDDPNVAVYRAEVSKRTDEFVAKWRERTDLGDSSATLKEALDDLESWERIKGIGNDSFYFSLRVTCDSNNADLQSKENQATEFYQNIVTKMQFFWLRIGAIAKDKQQELLDAPELQEYRHWLEQQFAGAKHQLSDAEERIMTLKSSVSRDKWREMTERMIGQGQRTLKDENGKEVTGGLEEILTLVSSRDKLTRDAAAEVLNDFLKGYMDVGEAEMNALLANKKIDDELRGYDRPDAARHLADDMDTQVVDTLLDAVSERFDISQRYYALKAKLLGQDKLAYHERNVPVGSLEKAYPYDEAIALVHEVYSEVDSELAAILTRMVEAGQVDVYPRKGKRGGAFCTINGLDHPVYVMLNHTDKLQDVSTIAHEFGHAMNHELCKKQNALNYGIGLATAEVASTFMEGFVLERLVRDADDELKLSLMIDQVNGAVSSIMRQVAMYRFEQEMHTRFREKGFLSQAEIGEIFSKHMSAYMGDAVTQDPGSENWWLYVGHFRVMFYVYSYAGGELISQALQAKVQNDPTFIATVKDKFLSVGGSKSVTEIFNDMGIDITDKTFWQDGLNKIDDLLSETEKLAHKLGKI